MPALHRNCHPKWRRDEWVRVLARAVGPYDGRLHLDAVLKDSKLVRWRAGRLGW